MARMIVVPGELVSDQRKRVGSNVFVREGKIYAATMGLTDPESEQISVIPLQGKYLPVRGDVVVGVVLREEYSGYIVDINSLYTSFLSKEELARPVQKGAVLTARVSEVDEIHEAKLEGVRVFTGGEILSVSPVKVPRLIGKNGSMLNLLKQYTGANLMVGRNGRVWASGGNISLVKDAILKIEAEAHQSNLTKKMEVFLGEAAPGQRNAAAQEPRVPQGHQAHRAFTGGE